MNAGASDYSGADTSPSVDQPDTRALAQTADVSIAGRPSTIAEFARTENGDVPNWETATRRFRARLKADSPHVPRFSSRWARESWGTLLGIDTNARTWADATVLLTLTGRTEYPGLGRPLPPCTHFTRLTDSRQARRKALSRCLQDINQWKRITVIGTDSTGYCHLHIGLYVSEVVEPPRFESVIQSHVDNSPVAEWDAHGDDTVQVEIEPSTDESTGLVGYAGLNVPGLDTRGDRQAGVLSESEHRVRGATVLEAGGWQAIR